MVGMTCQHCAMSVTEEIGEIPGVSAVDVELDQRRGHRAGRPRGGPTELAAAVSEAGFELVG